MYQIIHDILMDKKGGEIFVLFGFWHFLYIILTFITIIAIISLSYKKACSDGKKKSFYTYGTRAADVFGDIAFWMYIADFFLMPFAYEEIDIEKLPFHVCTATCVMCFAGRRFEPLKKYRLSITLLALVSNLIYLIYPAGVMWHAVHPLCYRVIQTLSFHAVMTVHCILTFVFLDEKDFQISFRRIMITVTGMTLWAVLGNLLYYGSAGSYDHDFNWFFVTADPFNIIKRPAGAYIMPFIVPMAFLAVEEVFLFIIKWLRKMCSIIFRRLS